VKVVSLATLSGGEAEMLAESIITEIEMSKRLSSASKHVVRMYDFDFHRQTGLAFLVMELGEQDLEKLLKGPRMSSAERKEIWRQLVDIAIVLHNNNIVIEILSYLSFFLQFSLTGTS
jgi:serine/threonine protein kinase